MGVCTCGAGRWDSYTPVSSARICHTARIIVALFDMLARDLLYQLPFRERDDISHDNPGSAVILDACVRPTVLSML